MRKYLRFAGMMIASVVLAAGSPSARAASILTIDDQNGAYVITHSDLSLTVTATGAGLPGGTVVGGSISVTQANADGDQVIVSNVDFTHSLTITQGTGLNDMITMSPQAMIGGVFNFSGTWALLPATAVTSGNFADVVYSPGGTVEDLLTWTVASGGLGVGSITGTVCTGQACAVRAFAVTVDPGPNSFSNQNLTATWVPVPEPASLALLGSALVGFGAIRRRRRKAA